MLIFLETFFLCKSAAPPSKLGGATLSKNRISGQKNTNTLKQISLYPIALTSLFFATEPSMAACEMFIAGNWISSIEYITCLTLVTCVQNLSRNSKMKHGFRGCYLKGRA